MEFVGNKDTIYESVLPAVNGFPQLLMSEFQTIFQFLSNESESSLKNHLVVSRAKVNSELKEKVSEYETLDALSMALFGETETGNVLYRQAVFALAASFVVGVQISTDTTAEAAERQQALEYKKGDCEVLYRRAVDMLMNGYETLTFEVF